MARRARTPSVAAPPRYEGSTRDTIEDAHGAGLLGITPAQYEAHPVDRMQDMMGQARLNRAHVMRAAANAVIGTHSGKGGRKR